MRLVLIAAMLVGATVAARAETTLERGAYLAQAVVACGNCHTPQTPNGPAPGMELAGKLLLEDEMMTAYAPNITPASRIHAWTDAELGRAIREGIRPDGSLIGPPMPFALYRDISDEDLAAIIAYVRAVPAVKSEIPPSVYRMPLPPAWGPPVGVVTAPDRSDLVAYGEYIAGPLAHCVECHSTPDEHGVPDLKNALGAGGFTFPGPWGESVSANITPAGIGAWSDQDIETAIRTGVRPDGRRLMPPMGFSYYSKMSKADMAALIAYLRTLPPR